jgi:hypothetical protein
MQFEGEDLFRILWQQTAPVLLCDAAGVLFTSIQSPREQVRQRLEAAGVNADVIARCFCRADSRPEEVPWFTALCLAPLHVFSIPGGRHRDLVAIAAQITGTRCFVGVGNKKRIRYIQAANPSVWGAGWRGGSHTTRPIRADASCRQHNVGQLLGSSKTLREHVPCPGVARRPGFASCPPVRVADDDVRGIGDAARLGREPGLSQTVLPANPVVFPVVPTGDPIDTQKLNGPVSWK